MRKAYAQALIDALQAGRLEVFSGSAAAFSGFQGDASALDVAMQALQNPKATTRRLAAEMLGRMETDSAIPALTHLISDPDPGVRTSAISSLGALRANFALQSIIQAFEDPEEPVREQALAATALLKPSATPVLLEKLNNLLINDPSLAVQMRAAITLAKLGSSEPIVSKATNWLRSPNTQTRLSALKMIEKISPELNHYFEPGLLTEFP